ncbi:MAG: phosphatase PAP2 family protein [Novosphingobium sp.]
MPRAYIAGALRLVARLRKVRFTAFLPLIAMIWKVFRHRRRTVLKSRGRGIMAMSRIYRAEAICAVLIALVSALALMLTTARGIRVDFASFAFRYCVGLAMVMVAAWYRVSGRSANISLTLAACAIFIIFSNSGAVLNYALLPTIRPLADSLMFRMDAALGFDWLRMAMLLAAYPDFSKLLSQVYTSSLPQLGIVILLLGFTGRQVALHQFLLVGIMGSCLSIFLWALAPSFGPSAYFHLAPDVDAALHRIVDANYGAELLELAKHGPLVITSGKIIGLIAFPSMHTVMAVMCVWFTRRTPVFWCFAAINFLMIPATLIQGGHHLVDVIGGVGVFAISLYVARKLVPGETGSLPYAGQLQVASGGRLIRMASILPPVLRPNSVPRS